jgi:hypothetical protein
LSLRIFCFTVVNALASMEKFPPFVIGFLLPYFR